MYIRDTTTNLWMNQISLNLQSDVLQFAHYEIGFETGENKVEAEKSNIY